MEKSLPVHRSPNLCMGTINHLSQTDSSLERWSDPLCLVQKSVCLRLQTMINNTHQSIIFQPFSHLHQIPSHTQAGLSCKRSCEATRIRDQAARRIPREGWDRGGYGGKGGVEVCPLFVHHAYPKNRNCFGDVGSQTYLTFLFVALNVAAIQALFFLYFNPYP